jgi:hypothetical protein
MSTAPTLLTNTQCTAFSTCDSETQLVVKPAARDDSRFRGKMVYTEDVECKARVLCDDEWQRTKVTDKYQHQCEDIAVKTYKATVRGTIKSQVEAESTEYWAGKLEDRRDSGADAGMNADTEGFASDKDVKVKSVSASITVNNGKETLTVSFEVIFIGFRARRSRIGQRSRRNDDDVELGDINPLPEGTVVCAFSETVSSDDDYCCIAGYGATNNACAACPNLQYSDGETAVLDNAGCQLQPTCGLSQVPPTFYISAEMTRTERADDNCGTLTSCNELGLLVSDEPTINSDRACAEENVVLCDHTSEFWSDQGLFDPDNNEWASNPECVTMKTCAVDSFWSNSESSYIWQVLAGVQHKVYVADRVCSDRIACGASEYISNLATIAAEGANSVVDNACDAWRICTNDQYQTMPPSLVQNRLCDDLLECAGNQYEVSAPTEGSAVDGDLYTSNRQCADVEDCPDGQYLTKTATTTKNRECEPWAECAADEEYECGEPSITANRQCCEVTDCTSDQIQTAGPTATSNRKCEDFGCEGLYEKYGTTDRVRMCNSRWTLCTDESLLTDSVCWPSP